jgi:CPA2 family monovalent cation:H+ antiporter-2
MKLHPRYRKGEVASGELHDHAILLGYGRAGQQTVQSLQEHGLEALVIDDDAGVIRKLISKGIPCIQGDGSDQAVLARANAQQARVVLCSMRRSQDALLALEYLREAKPAVLVRTFEPEETAMVQDAGGLPVEMAPAAATSFINWMEANELISNPAESSAQAQA